MPQASLLILATAAAMEVDQGVMQVQAAKAQENQLDLQAKANEVKYQQDLLSHMNNLDHVLQTQTVEMSTRGVTFHHLVLIRFSVIQKISRQNKRKISISLKTYLITRLRLKKIMLKTACMHSYLVMWLIWVFRLGNYRIEGLVNVDSVYSIK